MPDLTIKTGDTYPPLRGEAKDAEGLLPLAIADKLEIYLKKGTTVIKGTAEAIDPPDADGMNWKYKWAGGDTSIAGTYLGELRIIWDEGTSPPEIQRVPNDGTVEVEIEQAQE